MPDLYTTRSIPAGLLLAGALFTLPLFGTKPLQAQGAGSAPPKAAAPALTAKTDQTAYKAGSPIKLMLTAKNATQQDMPLRFGSGQRYDFELFRGKDAKGEKVWQWAKGKMFTMMLVSTTLKAGKSLEYVETYRPGSPDMPALAPGTYTVVATLKSVPKIPQSSTTATFQVK